MKPYKKYTRNIWEAPEKPKTKSFKKGKRQESKKAIRKGVQEAEIMEQDALDEDYYFKQKYGI